jgi:hypothetical protein
VLANQVFLSSRDSLMICYTEDSLSDNCLVTAYISFGVAIFLEVGITILMNY